MLVRVSDAPYRGERTEPLLTEVIRVRLTASVKANISGDTTPIRPFESKVVSGTVVGVARVAPSKRLATQVALTVSVGVACMEHIPMIRMNVLSSIGRRIYIYT